MEGTNLEKYQLVCGLEVHAQLLTHTKMYAGDKNEYGAEPNTLISHVNAGLPGTLPVVNHAAIDMAIKLGTALHCTINHRNEFARKNYFYADLPKGYQITQDKTPICTNGHIWIYPKNSEPKKIRIQRIHLEEDAGKSIHDIDPFNSLVDLNRAGVPLVEIVSEPDIRSSEEAYEYLTEIRKLVRYLDVCDGNMEEGSLRCDANISVMLKDATEFGKRVEVKNMNSIRNVKRAIEGEVVRQIELIEKGREVEQQTRSYNAASNTTLLMRSKEQAHDYRYFPEPDLQPLLLDDSYIKAIQQKMPALPKELKEKFMALGLSDYDAQVLTDEKEIALFFDVLSGMTKNYKAAVNWIIGPVKSYLNEKAVLLHETKLNPTHIAELVQMIDEGKSNFTAAARDIFPEMIEQGKSPMQIATEKNLIQLSDTVEIEKWIDEALAKYPDKVEAYKAGNKNLLGLFMGEVMKASKGKADPKLSNKLLMQKLA